MVPMLRVNTVRCPPTRPSCVGVAAAGASGRRERLSQEATTRTQEATVLDVPGIRPGAEAAILAGQGRGM
jgi:hypothetical protein